jgi:hypothetical protein
MKGVISVIGALLLFISIMLILAGLLLTKTQGDQITYGIYAIATGIVALVMLEASKDTTQV